MPHPEHLPPAAPTASPAYAPIRVSCPHCGQPLDVVPVTSAPPGGLEHRSSQAEAPAVRLSRAVVGVVQRRLFPLSSELEAQPDTGIAGEAHPSVAPAARPWGMVFVIIAGIVLIGALLIWWGRPASIPGAVAPPATLAQHDATADEAAILDTLTSYNRAESEAAARLSIEPLQPFMDPSGAFAQRRVAQITERQQRNAPHRTVLVRWAIGQITVEGTTATVVTQETWSNQEAGAVAPEQATVRVTYTLRRDATAGRWLIMESAQMGM